MCKWAQRTVERGRSQGEALWASQVVHSRLGGGISVITRKVSANLPLNCVVVVTLALSLVVSAPVYAQVAGATLSGSVTDASGAALPNATVSIRNTATGVSREVATDSRGFYSAPNLLPGPYDITFSAKGFTTVVEANLSLAVGEERSLDRTMQVGQI